MCNRDEQIPNFPKTVFFEACRGVFEGGGCRAAAYVGAYDAALKCGINFSEVAGTSAGAIVAALVGAGALPEFLDSHLKPLVFSSFLKEPEKYKLTSERWLNTLGRLLCLPLVRRIGLTKDISNVILYGGLYSSAPIEEWIDDQLSKLLPTANRPILFKDLLLPTRIVATDLVAGKAKIWGTRETPSESVGFAVRCSCSIPGFFQPVLSGINRYVDGGVLSNLPSFVFSAEDDEEKSSLGGRILAFRLREEFRIPSKWSAKNLLERLLAAVVGGATELQIAMQGDVHIVTIQTGTTRATDFRKIKDDDIKRLRRSGEQATINFVCNEGVYLRDTASTENSCRDPDELRDTLVKAAQEPAKEIYISEPNTLWFWKLFPSVLRWRSEGTQVKVLVTPNLETGIKAYREQQRRALLSGMGAEVKQVPKLPLSGYFIRREDDNHDAAILLLQRGTEEAPKATAYIGSPHREVIAATCDHLCGFFSKKQTVRVRLKSHPANKLVALLKKNVGEYTPSEVQIDDEEVPVENVKLITQYVRSYKYRQIAHLAAAYRAAKIPFFAAAAVFAGSDKISIVTPPVLEKWGNHLVTIEGNTRVLYCRRNGISQLHCLVVRGVKKPLPGQIVDPRRVVLSTRHMEPKERMKGFRYARFRSIEGAVRPVREVKVS